MNSKIAQSDPPGPEQSASGVSIQGRAVIAGLVLAGIAGVAIYFSFALLTRPAGLGQFAAIPLIVLKGMDQGHRCALAGMTSEQCQDIQRARWKAVENKQPLPEWPK